MVSGQDPLAATITTLITTAESSISIIAWFSTMQPKRCKLHHHAARDGQPMSRCIKISTPSTKNRRHGEDKLRRSSPSKRPGELVGRDERVAAAASASVTGAEVPALEAQDEIRVQEAVEQPEAVVGRGRGGGSRVLHPARRLLLPHPRPPPAHSRPHRIVKSDTAALPSDWEGGREGKVPERDEADGGVGGG